ncbi:MAG: hypothetical protein HZC49_06970 [Nitrospirae bacterium]|nr:hypothetical protein [Nitrospirota bacterium]
MDIQDKSYGRGTGLHNFHNRFSLTLKMVLVTIVIGICLWALLDYVHTTKQH